MRNNKADPVTFEALVKEVSELTGDNLDHTREVINKALLVIKRNVAEGRMVKLRRFGTFRARISNARVGRDIRTEEFVHIPPMVKPVFVPGEPFKDLVQNPSKNVQEKSE